MNLNVCMNDVCCNVFSNCIKYIESWYFFNIMGRMLRFYFLVFYVLGLILIVGVSI